MANAGERSNAHWSMGPRRALDRDIGTAGGHLVNERDVEALEDERDAPLRHLSELVAGERGRSCFALAPANGHLVGMRRLRRQQDQAAREKGALEDLRVVTASERA